MNIQNISSTKENGFIAFKAKKHLITHFKKRI